MRTWIRTLTVGCLVTMGTVACESGTEPDTVDDAALRAETALLAVDGMFQDLSVFTDLGLPGFDLSPTEAAEATDNFSFTRTRTFFDAEGEEMDRYDALLTASIHVVVDAEGTRERAFWDAEIERHREYTITGLLEQETERTTNGTGTETVFRSRHPDDRPERTYDMNASVTYDDVVHGVPRIQHPYPLSGTITRHVHVIVREDGEVIGERDVTAVITFDGTQYATVEVDGDTWTVDLAINGVNGRFQKKNR